MNILLKYKVYRYERDACYRRLSILQNIIDPKGVSTSLLNYQFTTLNIRLLKKKIVNRHNLCSSNKIF